METTIQSSVSPAQAYGVASHSNLKGRSSRICRELPRTAGRSLAAGGKAGPVRVRFSGRSSGHGGVGAAAIVRGTRHCRCHQKNEGTESPRPRWALRQGSAAVTGFPSHGVALVSRMRFSVKGVDAGPAWPLGSWVYGEQLGRRDRPLRSPPEAPGDGPRGCPKEK